VGKNTAIGGKKVRLRLGASMDSPEIQMEPGVIASMLKVVNDGKPVTLYTVEVDEEGTLIYEIHDWEQFEKTRYSMGSCPEFIMVKKLPAFRDYVYRSASGDTEGEENLGQIEHHARDGEVIKLDVTALENRIKVKHISENVFEIRFPKQSVCEECGEIYMPRRTGQKYHTRKCANRATVRAFRKRQKEKKASKNR
jgi:hypothetical protein